MQVYVGDAQVYAKDTTSGTYAKEKRYTYYAALFADKARTQKVSDVKEITVSGLSGSASFSSSDPALFWLPHAPAQTAQTFLRSSLRPADAAPGKW